jgi:hypothetical protein
MKRFRTVLFLAFLSLAIFLPVFTVLAQDIPESDEIVSGELEVDAAEPEVVIEEDVFDEYVPTEEAEQKPPMKFVVLLPEQIDRQWFWFYYTDEAQHIVQSSVEKALIDVGVDVIDVASMDSSGSINDIMSKDSALQKAKAIGAEYAIIATAIADKKSEGAAYGVTVIRASATITARIIRVADGKVIAVEEAEAEEGGQALKGASRDALKKAGRENARKLSRAAQGIAAH